MVFNVVAILRHGIYFFVCFLKLLVFPLYMVTMSFEDSVHILKVTKNCQRALLKIAEMPKFYCFLILHLVLPPAL